MSIDIVGSAAHRDGEPHAATDQRTRDGSTGPKRSDQLGSSAARVKPSHCPPRGPCAAGSGALLKPPARPSRCPRAAISRVDANLRPSHLPGRSSNSTESSGGQRPGRQSPPVGGTARPANHPSPPPQRSRRTADNQTARNDDGNAMVSWLAVIVERRVTATRRPSSLASPTRPRPFSTPAPMRPAGVGARPPSWPLSLPDFAMLGLAA